MTGSTWKSQDKYLIFSRTVTLDLITKESSSENPCLCHWWMWLLVLVSNVKLLSCWFIGRTLNWFCFKMCVSHCFHITGATFQCDLFTCPTKAWQYLLQNDFFFEYDTCFWWLYMNKCLNWIIINTIKVLFLHILYVNSESFEINFITLSVSEKNYCWKTSLDYLMSIDQSNIERTSTSRATFFLE